MPGTLQSNSTTYLSVVGGRLRQTVDDKTDGAILRQYETPEGKKGEKYELVFKNWEGNIRGLRIEDTKFGTFLKISFSDAVVSINTSSKYFQTFAKKIFSADLTKPVLITPYDFEPDGERKIGISIKQNEEPLKNFFWDKEKGCYSDEFPKYDESKKGNKAYSKIYRATVEEFLIDKIKEIKIPEAEIPELGSSKKDVEQFAKENKRDSEPVNEQVEIEDLPF